jgi:hypothetical protein
MIDAAKACPGSSGICSGYATFCCHVNASSSCDGAAGSNPEFRIPCIASGAAVAVAKCGNIGLI